MAHESRGRVLVVEARPNAARAMAALGFQLTSATKEKEALELSSQRPFDAVVVDLDVFRLDGRALARRLQQVGASSIVWLTSAPTNELSVAAAEAGVVQVLGKPADTESLERIVTLAVERRRSLFSVLRGMTRSGATPKAVPATSAKNEFGTVLDAAVQDGAVVITKHDAPKAVLVSLDRVNALLAKDEPNLEALTREFDAMVARMQTDRARAAARSLFTAEPPSFGAAAVEAAKKHG